MRKEIRNRKEKENNFSVLVCVIKKRDSLCPEENFKCQNAKSTIHVICLLQGIYILS